MSAPRSTASPAPGWWRGFIDKEPEFLFVAPDGVLDTARETGTIPYDVPGVGLTHVGELCRFDTFLQKTTWTTRLCRTWR